MKTYYNDPIQQVQFENKDFNKDEVIAYFQKLSFDKESFLGLLDTYDEVIIFYPKAKDQWLVDHLVVPSTLHRQCYASTAECLVFIEKLYREEDIHRLKGFEEVPVQEFTLDEMLQFKKEDEALLREEDISFIEEEEINSKKEDVSHTSVKALNDDESLFQLRPQRKKLQKNSSMLRNKQQTSIQSAEQIEEETSTILLRPKKKPATLVSPEPEEVNKKGIKEKEVHTNSEEALLQLKPSNNNQSTTKKVVEEKPPTFRAKKEGSSSMLLKPRKRPLKKTAVKSVPKTITNSDKNKEEGTSNDNSLLEI